MKFKDQLNIVVALSVIATSVTLSAEEPIKAPAENQDLIFSPRRISSDDVEITNDALLKVINEAIEITSRRYLVANEHSPWQMYHGLVGLRRNLIIEADGKLIPAIDWISQSNPYFRGLPWFQETAKGGRAHRYTVPYHFEGHPNQSFALMTLCNLPRDFEFYLDGGKVLTMQEMIENAQWELNPKEELTWTLWFLVHYLDTDEVWQTKYGETWSIEKIVADQVNTQVTKAACGGTHNLFALAYARNKHLRDQKRLTGVWRSADYKLRRYIAAAQSLQRRDGSFPTQYFRGYGTPTTFSEKISSSGHMMEWLMVALSDRQLNYQWVRRGVYYLAKKLIAHRDEAAECGPLYHTVDALVLYRDRKLGVDWPNPDQAEYEILALNDQPDDSEPEENDPPAEITQPKKTAEVTSDGPQSPRIVGSFPSAMIQETEEKSEDTDPVAEPQPPLISATVESLSKQAADGRISVGGELLIETEVEVEMIAQPLDDSETVIQ